MVHRDRGAGGGVRGQVGGEPVDLRGAGVLLAVGVHQVDPPGAQLDHGVGGGAEVVPVPGGSGGVVLVVARHRQQPVREPAPALGPGSRERRYGAVLVLQVTQREDPVGIQACGQVCGGLLLTRRRCRGLARLAGDVADRDQLDRHARRGPGIGRGRARGGCRRVRGGGRAAPGQRHEGGGEQQEYLADLTWGRHRLNVGRRTCTRPDRPGRVRRSQVDGRSSARPWTLITTKEPPPCST